MTPLRTGALPASVDTTKVRVIVALTMRVYSFGTTAAEAESTLVVKGMAALAPSPSLLSAKRGKPGKSVVSQSQGVSNAYVSVQASRRLF